MDWSVRDVLEWCCRQGGWGGRVCVAVIVQLRRASPPAAPHHLSLLLLHLTTSQISLSSLLPCLWRVCSGVSLFNLPAQREPTTTTDTSQRLLPPLDLGLSTASRSCSSVIIPAVKRSTAEKQMIKTKELKTKRYQRKWERAREEVWN